MADVVEGLFFVARTLKADPRSIGRFLPLSISGMNDDRVAVEKTYGCKVFSAKSREEFFKWLSDLEASMTPEHADGLSWAYARYRKL